MHFPPTTRELPSQPTVCVVGATGLVGDVLLAVLEERGFPVGELRLLAGPGSVGAVRRFRGRELVLGTTGPEAFEGADLVFFAATGELSRTLAPLAVAAGARVIDKSATWRMEPEVPLVVPEVNGASLDPRHSMVACPNCTTIGVVMALEPLRRAAGLRRVVLTTLQAASGAGRAGLRQLESELAAGTRGPGDPPGAGATFPVPLAGNALPLCGSLESDANSSEEHRLLAESRRILGLPELEVEASCARVPVAVGHTASIWLETERPLGVVEARAALSAFPGVRLVELPTPAEAAGDDHVLVGRVRVPTGGRGLALWQVADNLRKGAALNAVQIAERWLAI